MGCHILQRLGRADKPGSIVLGERHDTNVTHFEDAQQIGICLLTGIVQVRALREVRRIHLDDRAAHQKLNLWICLCHLRNEVVVEPLVDDSDVGSARGQHEQIGQRFADDGVRLLSFVGRKDRLFHK